MTHELETYLRHTLGKSAQTTTPGIGPGGWDSGALAREQTRVGADNVSTIGPAFNTAKTLYRLYTENVNPLAVRNIVTRYFDGATILTGVGLDARTQQDAEPCIVVEIVSSAQNALQRVLDCAGDIRQHNAQISVLVTVQDVRTFEVVAS